MQAEERQELRADGVAGLRSGRTRHLLPWDRRMISTMTDDKVSSGS
jgi:hypothetical protein